MPKKLNEDFLDSYCEKFASGVAAKFFVGGKKVISGKEILEVTPSKQVNFFVIKLLFRYWQEETKKLESPFFNYKHEEVRQAMIQFMNVLSQHIEINRPKFETLLNHAVKDALYLASMPQAYIEIDLDGRGVEQITDKAIEGTTKYLNIYKKEIHDFLKDMKGLSIDDVLDELPDEFETFDTTDAVMELSARLSKVLEITLEKIYSEDPDIEDFDEDDLFVQGEEDLVETPSKQRKPRRSREYHRENKEVEITHDDLEMEDEEITEDAYGTITPASPDTSEKQTESNADTEKGEILDSVDEKAVEAPVMLDEEEKEDEFPQETINQQFEGEQETLAEHHESVRKGDSILELISLNNRYMFIKELFQNDKDQFEKALAELEDFSSFDESVEFLVTSYARHNEWDMQSDEVKEFLKVLFRRHR
ncbi:MAG: hypothetical protein AAF616_10720 [Bacteroidota bacterium]